ncbi:MAG: DUF58 domain-containing protein [Tepidisphaeraceae bacterium]|jgi:uncharacterized protein (DUF58 family)
MPIPRYQYFAPGDAAKMSRLQLTARQVVEGIITGLHKSPHHGFSVEFTEHRNYVPGDELRHLDWKAYARSDRHYIKLFEQETNLQAMLVLDNSASMTFAGKMDYARHLAACLAYLLAEQQDLAGLAAIDESIHVELAPGSTAGHLDRLFVALQQLEAGKKTDFAAQLHALVQRLPRRSLVILISDLWMDAPQLSGALQHLRYRKHQGIVLHLLDKAELELPYDRPVTLVDLETDQTLQIIPADLRATYQRAVQEHLTDLRRICNDCDVEYQAFDVRQPYDRALVQWLSRRK